MTQELGASRDVLLVRESCQSITKKRVKLENNHASQEE